jgi:hypothetical protein
VAWGLLALVAVYLVDRPLRVLLAGPPSRAGELLLGAVLAAMLLSAVLTAAALVRLRRRLVALRTRPVGAEPFREPTWAGRLLDRLAPDPVLINTFPRMSLVVELMDLTGQERGWVRLPARRPLGRAPQPLAGRGLQDGRRRVSARPPL